MTFGAWLLQRAFPVLLATGFVGCMLGPRVEQPTAETPELYRMQALQPDTVAADSLLNLKWWELFGDPALDSLVERGLRENRDLRIAMSRIEEARAVVGFTGADVYPKLDISASVARGDIAQGFRLESEQNSFFIAPVLSWELDFWGKYRSATDAARSELIASQFGLRRVQVSLISEIAGSYFVLLDLRNRLHISRETLVSRELALRIIQMRFDEGIIPEIDVYQARIQREIAAGAVPSFERQVARTEHALSILVGSLPTEIRVDTLRPRRLMPPEIPMGIPAQLLDRRPDISEADYRYRAQTARVGVAEALRLPAISLTGLLGYASNDLSTLTSGGLGWSASGQLFGPIFNFNKNIRRVEIEEERMRQALLVYEGTVLNAFREVEDALADVRTYRNQLDAKEREYEAARSGAELSRSRYDKGVTSYLEVLESERSLFSVELELSQLLQLYNNSYVGLYKVLGGGWLTPEEMEQATVQSREED